VLLASSTKAAWTWLGPLSELATATLPGSDLPATIAIGDVVALAGAHAAPAAFVPAQEAR